MKAAKEHRGDRFLVFFDGVLAKSFDTFQKAKDFVLDKIAATLTKPKRKRK